MAELDGAYVPENAIHEGYEAHAYYSPRLKRWRPVVSSVARYGVVRRYRIADYDPPLFTSRHEALAWARQRADELATRHGGPATTRPS